MSVERLEITNPRWGGQNADHHNSYLIVVNDNRWVAIKNCERRIDGVKREQEIAELRQRLGMPHYYLMARAKFLLRPPQSTSNVPDFRDWQDLPHVLIDFGSAGRRISLHRIRETKIHIPNQEKTFTQLGEWFAFNTIFGVIDRHLHNFVFDPDSDQLLSVDNEDLASIAVNPDAGLADYEERRYAEAAEVLGGRLSADQVSSCRQNFARAFRERWDKIALNRGILEQLPVTATIDLARLRIERINRELILQQVWV